MARLFVALHPPTHITAALEALREDELPGRWLPAASMHLTLRFLGDVDETRAEALAARLSEIRLPPADVVLEEVDVFPSRRSPRVLVVRCARTPTLMTLQAEVERRVQEQGFEGERRAFNPHLTLARLRGAAPVRVGDYLQRHADEVGGAFTADAFRLYESTLLPSGARYVVRAAFPLVPRP